MNGRVPEEWAGEREGRALRDEDAPPVFWLVEPEAVTAGLNGLARAQEATYSVAICALGVGILALGAICGPALWAGLARLLGLAVRP